MRLAERCAVDESVRELVGHFVEMPCSPDRVRAFVGDFLLTGRLAAYRAFWADGNDGGTNVLTEAVFEHVWPQAAFVAPLRLDFVGRACGWFASAAADPFFHPVGLETLDADVARLGRRVGAPLAWNPAVTGKRGGDAPGERAATNAAKRAARAALADDATLLAALCYVYLGDFAAFGYDLPAACADLPVTALP